MAKPTDAMMKERYANILNQGFGWKFDPSKDEHRDILAVAEGQVYKDNADDRRAMYGVLDTMAISVDLPLGFTVKRSDDGKRENDVYTLDKAFTQACVEFAEKVRVARPPRESGASTKLFNDAEKIAIKKSVKSLKALLDLDDDMDMIPAKVRVYALGAGEKVWKSLPETAQAWAKKNIQSGESHGTACRRLIDAKA